jgi:hypothetical protein
LINRSVFGKEIPEFSKTCWKCQNSGKNNLESVSNKILSVCQCEEGIHLECLRKAIKQKMKTPVKISEGIHYLAIQDFSCDICNYPYERKFP